MTALSQLTGSLASLAHSLPHRRQRQQQQHAAPEHTTLDLEVTGAEAMWLANADVADWDLPAVAETTPSLPPNLWLFLLLTRCLPTPPPPPQPRR